MRISQTSDGRYVKVMSPQFEGAIGRIYGEIRDRKAVNQIHDDALADHNRKIGIISSQMDTMLIRYTEMTELLRRMFPEDEPIAVIEKPLEVSGGVKAANFVSTIVGAAPLAVASKIMVTNLNVEFLGGKNLGTVQSEAATDATNKVNALNTDVTQRFANAKAQADKDYAPIAHVGSAGIAAHPVVTDNDAGFMSPIHKGKVDGVNLPGGITASTDQPVNPKVSQIWIDLN